MGELYSYNNNEEIKLPNSVRKLLNQICKDQNQNSPDEKVMKLLNAIGEEPSLHILKQISKYKIKKTLSAFIVFMAKQYYSSETQQFYQQQNSSAQQVSVSSAESIYYYSPQTIRSFSVSSPISSNSSVNFSPRNGPLFQEYDIVGDTSASPTSAPRLWSPPMSPATTSSQRDHNDPRPSVFRDSASTHGISEHLHALSELEFRKFFLILNYIGRRKLEDVIMLHDVGDILDMTYQPMSHFESYIWNKYGHLCENNKRVQYLDWDSGRTHLYHCHVHSDGSYTFKVCSSCGSELGVIEKNVQDNCFSL